MFEKFCRFILSHRMESLYEHQQSTPLLSGEKIKGHIHTTPLDVLTLSGLPTEVKQRIGYFLKDQWLKTFIKTSSIFFHDTVTGTQ